MTDREAFEAWWVKVYGTEYAEKFHRVWQAALATAPGWHDVPTEPGLWLVHHDLSAAHFNQYEIDNFKPGPRSWRWYGPIPIEEAP